MLSRIKTSVKTLLARFLTLPPFSALGEFLYRGQVTVFFMHRVAIPELGVHGHSLEFLREALQYLKKKNYTFLSLQDLCEPDSHVKLREIKKAVAFTIDDGFFDQAEMAAKVFVENQCPVTIFLISGFIDNELWPWDDQVAYLFHSTAKSALDIEIGGEKVAYALQTDSDKRNATGDFQRRCKWLSPEDLQTSLDRLSIAAEIPIPAQPPEQYRPLTWDLARKLEPQGVSFGPHSCSHNIFSRLSPAQAEQEISQSIKRLSEELKHPLPVFAWPTGRKQDFNESNCRILGQHGMHAAFSTEPGNLHLDFLQQDNRRYSLKRMPLPDNMVDLIQYASWIEPFKDDLRSAKLALVEYAHVLTVSALYRLRALFGLTRQYNHIDWSRIKRLVFVCKGNVCRSPYAEFKALQQKLSATSLGIHASGRISANDEAIRQSAARGIDLMPHITRPVDTVELTTTDLVVCMEPMHIEAMQGRVEDAGSQMTLLGLWGPFNTPIIADPYGRSPGFFQSCYEKMDLSLKGLIDRLQQAGSK